MKKLIIIIALVTIGYVSYGQSMHGLSYSMALPTGKTSDLISKYQWRGFGMEGKYFMTDQVTLGWQTGWNTMYQEESGTFIEDTRSMTGTQYRWLNVWPALLTANYFFGSDGDTQPYLGVGIGTYWVEQKVQMGLFGRTYSTWNFALAPEVGVLFPLNLNSNLYLNLKYNYGMNGSEDVEDYSYLTFNVGFLWY
jgi:opacity protein-like surface antigen